MADFLFGAIIMATPEQIRIWLSKEKLRELYLSISEDREAFLNALATDKRCVNIQNYKDNVPVMEMLDWGMARENHIKFAVENGLNLETVGYMGDTILALLVRKNNKKMVEYLLNKGANPNVRNIYGGRTPLIMAAEMGEVEMVQLLLKFQADPRLTDKVGRTPLMLSKSLREDVFSDSKRAHLAQSPEFVKKGALVGFDKNRDNMILIESFLNAAEKERQ